MKGKNTYIGFTADKTNEKQKQKRGISTEHTSVVLFS